MTLWAETFNKLYPNVKIQIEGKGSSTAPPALISGDRPARADVARDEGERDRRVREEVRLQADADPRRRRRPRRLRQQGQPDRLPRRCRRSTPIFSKSRRAGYKENVKTWGQLGLTGDWAARPISLFGRNSASGTYGFFKEHVMKNGDYKDEVKEQPGSASVVQGVTVDRYAIGYSGIGYTTAGVKAVPLAAKAGRQVPPGRRAEQAYAGSYPLARFLYVYVNKAPNKPLDPLVREFVKMVLSKEGQEVVVKDGYFPLPGRIEQEEPRSSAEPGRARRRVHGRRTPGERAGGAGPPRRPPSARRVVSSRTGSPAGSSRSRASSSSPRSWRSSSSSPPSSTRSSFPPRRARRRERRCPPAPRPSPSRSTSTARTPSSRAPTASSSSRSGRGRRGPRRPSRPRRRDDRHGVRSRRRD